ncbi:hypothetical protein E2C01_056588 [Portunus trituberculatus]|uniref:Uncharacterized protein n=1 Tax=Portunus trituberculatus TaxID=210409 RepID=A0A5B7GXU5_PORTR|nr:hypothetical protein [Portunus trituberculatus]
MLLEEEEEEEEEEDGVKYKTPSSDGGGGGGGGGRQWDGKDHYNLITLVRGCGDLVRTLGLLRHSFPPPTAPPPGRSGRWEGGARRLRDERGGLCGSLVVHDDLEQTSPRFGQDTRHHHNSTTKEHIDK